MYDVYKVSGVGIENTAPWMESLSAKILMVCETFQGKQPVKTIARVEDVQAHKSLSVRTSSNQDIKL